MNPRYDTVLRFAYLLLCFIFIACFSQPRVPRQSPSSDSAVIDDLDGISNAALKNPALDGQSAEKSFDIWKENPEDFYAIVGELPRPGDPVTVIFLPAKDNNRKLEASLVSGSGKRLGGAPFFDWVLDDEGHSVKACVFSVPSTFDGTEAVVRIEGADIFEIRLKERKFVAEEIPLNPSNTALRTVPDPRKTAESERLWAIISRSGGTVYATGPFTPPVAADTRRTSFFGDRRVYRYSNGKSDTAVHAGIDYGVPTGTPVSACAAGRVVLAGERIVTGNSVIIEHLPGVYSIYYHLDRIFAEEGAVVKEGDLIGLSGSTGLATGPHLHWELRAASENTDPDVLCARPILDGAAAKKIIKERGEQIYAELSR
ncbi:MAG: M23 family metallopeptidase [Spirochaetaceae bacterium]|jgi:murein DD-endopeptidase MepM/ murein hydrolase activator NlpD|nr:M23 family metallopeptidase [Spirochaetaceae bacterium]